MILAVPERNVRDYLAWGLLAAIPAIVSIASLYHVGINPLLYWPLVSDDVVLNHQIRTFAAAGFSGGYYTIDERPAALAFTHFGPHGPFYPLIYGSLLAPLQAPVSGPIWLHHIGLSLALLAAFAILRVSLARSIAIAFVAATFWPIIVMLSLSMQEGFHAIVAVGLAASVSSIERSSVRFTLAALISAMVRPTWALAVLPALSGPRSPFGAVVRLAICVALLFVTFAVFSLFAAPVDGGVKLAGAGAAHGWQGLLDIVHVLGERVSANLTALSAGSLEPLERQTLVIAAVVTVWAALPKQEWRIRACALTLLLLLTAVMAAYDLGNYRGFRTLSGPLFFTVLTGLLVVRGTKFAALSAVLLIVNAAYLPAFLEFQKQNRTPTFSQDRPALMALSEKLKRAMPYRAGANPWCNTVLIDRTQIGGESASIPPGYGISVLTSAVTSANAKSAYVWVHDLNPSTRTAPPHLVKLVDLGTSILFFNKKSACTAP